MNHPIHSCVDHFQQIKKPEIDQKNTSYTVCLSERLTLDKVKSLTNWMNGRCVTSLSLSGTGLNDDAVDLIAAAIRMDNVRHRSLRSVNLSNNRIGDRGAITLSSIAAQVPNVFISLNGNEIGSHGAIEFIKGVASGNFWSRVDLSENRIDDEGVRKLSIELARYSGRIRDLNLSHNPITLQGDQEMARHLPQRIHVTYRTEKISFEEWTERHPFGAMFLFICLLPLYLILACFQSNMEEPVEGLITPRTGPK